MNGYLQPQQATQIILDNDLRWKMRELLCTTLQLEVAVYPLNLKRMECGLLDFLPAPPNRFWT